MNHLLALLILAVQQPGGVTPTSEFDDRPDVVLFVIDDVADSDIDYSSTPGIVPTPTLHRLASRGVRFRRAYAHAWCAPTRDSLLHSQWLGTSRGDDCSPAVPQTRSCGDYNMAKMFEGMGYNTCHFGKWHIGSNAVAPWELTPLLNGYDHALVTEPIGASCRIPNDVLRVDDGVVSQQRGNQTILVRDAFIRWWNSTPSPRFACVNFDAAHSPYVLPPSSILPFGYPSPSNATDRQKYEAEIASVDFAIRTLLPLFGQEDWIVFTGDNGTPSDVARPDQVPSKLKLSCYEDGIRVPLIVSGPGTLVGHESQALVHLIDLLPTLADLIGAPTPPVDGLSFTPALHGLAVPRHFTFSHNPGSLSNAMLNSRWKLLTRGDGVEVLYDLLDDPREQHPLPPTGPHANYLRMIRDRILDGQSVLTW